MRVYFLTPVILGNTMFRHALLLTLVSHQWCSACTSLQNFRKKFAKIIYCNLLQVSTFLTCSKIEPLFFLSFFFSRNWKLITKFLLAIYNCVLNFYHLKWLTLIHNFLQSKFKYFELYINNNQWHLYCACVRSCIISRNTEH